MKKRWLTIALSLGVAASCCMMPACGGGGDKDSATQTTIRIGTYNGGVGMQWLKDAAQRFSDKYSGKSFEEGKTGVDVRVYECDTGSMIENAALKRDVYFTEVVDYIGMQKKGLLADISDVVTGSLSAYNEEGTIEGKLDNNFKSFLTAKDGKYYGLPFYDGIYGLVYDMDLFANQGWYLDEDGEFTKTAKSKGIDGVENTYDDGLPRTYAEFATLLEKISATATPILYAEESTTYFINILANFWADYEGEANMSKNWTLSGKADIVTGFNEKGEPVLGELDITESNYKELQKQPGKYYALSFLKDILLSNGKYSKSEPNGFKAAQYSFITSYLDGQKQDNAYAIIAEGAWFENEAQDSLSFEMAAKKDAEWKLSGRKDYENYKKTRNLAFMPIPKANEAELQKSNKQTIVSSNDSFCFVNAATTGAKLDVAKEFIKFLHTDAELSLFTQTTSITRPLNYKIEKGVLDNMTTYAKSLIEMKASSNIVYPYSNSELYLKYSSQFTLGAWSWVSSFSGKPNNPFVYMKNNSKVTAKDYFESLADAH